MMKNSKEQTTALPELRFPEFRDSEGWIVKPLSNIANIIAGQSPEGSSYNENGIGTPFYQGKTDFGKIYLKAPTKWTTKTTKLANNGDILMSVRAPVGALNISTNKICIGRGLAAIQPHEDKWFLYYTLNSIQNSIIGNGGSVFDSINKDQIEKIKILIPKSVLEQAKIAECFSSLDDLISAVADKIEVLKEHKKGLMQQLFPAEGSTVPARRFPEFQNAPEWHQVKLGDIADVTKLAGYEYTKYVKYEDSGKIIAVRGLNCKNGQLDLTQVKYIDNSDLSMLERSKLIIGDILFTYVGTVGEVAMIEENDKFYLAPNVSRIRMNKGICPSFIKQLISSESFYNNIVLTHIATSSQPALSMANIRRFILMIPKSENEQKKVVDCLTSIDDQITAETQKLDQLKAHKKGLMQRLFPKV